MFVRTQARGQLRWLNERARRARARKRTETGSLERRQRGKAAIMLTDVKVRNLRYAQLVKDAEVTPGRAYVGYDQQATGLAIKVTPKDKKLWLLQAKFPGNRWQARRVLGEYPAVSLGQARDKADEWRKQVKAGIDPTVEAAKAKAERERQEAAK